jgi:hypothetical protein
MLAKDELAGHQFINWKQVLILAPGPVNPVRAFLAFDLFIFLQSDPHTRCNSSRFIKNLFLDKRGGNSLTETRLLSGMAMREVIINLVIWIVFQRRFFIDSKSSDYSLDELILHIHRLWRNSAAYWWGSWDSPQSSHRTIVWCNESMARLVFCEIWVQSGRLSRSPFRPCLGL